MPVERRLAIVVAAQPPMRMFSSTVIAVKIWRPSGTHQAETYALLWLRR